MKMYFVITMLIYSMYFILFFLHGLGLFVFFQWYLYNNKKNQYCVSEIWCLAGNNSIVGLILAGQACINVILLCFSGFYISVILHI